MKAPFRVRRIPGVSPDAVSAAEQPLQLRIDLWKEVYLTDARPLQTPGAPAEKGRPARPADFRGAICFIPV
jgi:hypothetical protein